MTQSKILCCGIICCIHLMRVQAQNSNNNLKTNAFTIRGNINASANFYNSNEINYTRPGFAWNINANLIAKVNKVTLPFSFILNQYEKSNASPYIQIGISPTYKWAKLHLGYRYIPFSPLTLEGQSFRGAGLELNPRQFHFAAFYGQINKAVNQDTSRAHFLLPQYSRKAYGVKIGYGNLKNFFNLIYFHAKDDSSSAAIIKDTARSNPAAKENAVLGASFKFTVVKKLSLAGDVAIGGLTQNLNHDKANLDSGYQYKSLGRILNKFIPFNASSFASYAGQSILSFNDRNYNAALSYRRVQPYFTSLGTPYLLNDIELISLANNFSVSGGKLNINTHLAQQHNNLNKNLNTELQTRTGNININVMPSQHLNVNCNYAIYNIKQKDAAIQLTEVLRLQQNITQFTISPSYNFTNETKIHFISASVNVSVLKDKNADTTIPRANSNNLSTSINYNIGFIKEMMNFSLNVLYNQYKQDSGSYKCYGATIGGMVQLLKDKNLNLQANVGYLINRSLITSSQNNSNNITYSFGATYNAKRHTFNLSVNYVYTPPNAINDRINKIFQYVVASKNLNGSIAYNYSF